jgi:hypothetical protein
MDTVFIFFSVLLSVIYLFFFVFFWIMLINYKFSYLCKSKFEEDSPFYFYITNLLL